MVVLDRRPSPQLHVLPGGRVGNEAGKSLADTSVPASAPATLRLVPRGALLTPARRAIDSLPEPPLTSSWLSQGWKLLSATVNAIHMDTRGSMNLDRVAKVAEALSGLQRVGAGVTIEHKINGARKALHLDIIGRELTIAEARDSQQVARWSRENGVAAMRAIRSIDRAELQRFLERSELQAKAPSGPATRLALLAIQQLLSDGKKDPAVTKVLSALSDRIANNEKFKEVVALAGHRITIESRPLNLSERALLNLRALWSRIRGRHYPGLSLDPSKEVQIADIRIVKEGVNLKPHLRWRTVGQFGALAGVEFATMAALSALPTAITLGGALAAATGVYIGAIKLSKRLAEDHPRIELPTKRGGAAN